VDAIDRWEGELLRRRENIPLAVMSVVSLAVLFVFGFSEMAMRAAPQQLGGCDAITSPDAPMSEPSPRVC
jgi:hypothetical protein